MKLLRYAGKDEDESFDFGMKNRCKTKDLSCLAFTRLTPSWYIVMCRQQSLDILVQWRMPMRRDPGQKRKSLNMLWGIR
jgi:hypothetical protein